MKIETLKMKDLLCGDGFGWKPSSLGNNIVYLNLSGITLWIRDGCWVRKMLGWCFKVALCFFVALLVNLVFYDFGCEILRNGI